MMKCQHFLLDALLDLERVKAKSQLFLQYAIRYLAYKFQSTMLATSTALSAKPHCIKQ